MPFNKSVELLSAVENSLLMKRILIKKENNGVVNKLYNGYLSKLREVLLPVGLVIEGFKILLHDIKFFCITFFPVFIFIKIVKLDQIEHLIEGIFILSFIVSFFPLPSFFCHYGVENKHIDIVKKVLVTMEIKKKEIDDLTSFINDYKLKIKQRLLALKGIVIFLWACYLFFMSKFFLPVSIDEAVNLFIGSSGYNILLIFGCYLFVESYSKGIWLIVKSLDFALIEFKKEFEHKVISKVRVVDKSRYSQLKEINRRSNIKRVGSKI